VGEYLLDASPCGDSPPGAHRPYIAGMMVGSRPRSEGPLDALPHAAAHDHLVQFYESEECLHTIVGGFLAAGVSSGQPALAITAPGRRQAFSSLLTAAGVDVGRAGREGLLTFLDAAETLERVTRDGAPDFDRFRLVVGGAVERLVGGTPGRKVRVYGDIVDLSWRAGSPGGAVQLERLWNDLARTHPIVVMCSYAMDTLGDEPHTREIQEVLNGHAYVVPAESWAQAGDANARLREVVRLQHRGRVLEHELERRRDMEQALREALDEKRRLEERMRAQNEALTRAVRLSETFVGMLGHDLRNPLNAISTAATLVARRSETELISKPALRIVRSARRMARMIDQILDFTRIRLGKGLPLAPRTIDLVEVCRLATDELEGETAEPRVKIEASGDVAGCWDADRLAQLVSNLVANALSHGRPGTPVSILIDGHDACEVVLQVANAGSVPPAVLPALFEPFAASSAGGREASHGLGLGLHISRQIATTHGGSIDVASAEERTRFTVRLPRTPPPQS
jgi:signal transduction histidine kinase